jgi:hypothetical protein
MLNHICQQRDSVSVYVEFIYLHLLGPGQRYTGKPGGPLVFFFSSSFSSSFYFRDRVSPWNVGKPSHLKRGCLPKNISLDSLDYLSWTSYLQPLHEFVYCCSVWNKCIRKYLSMSMTTLPVFNSCIIQKHILLQCNSHSDHKWLTEIWKNVCDMQHEKKPVNKLGR